MRFREQFTVFSVMKQGLRNRKVRTSNLDLWIFAQGKAKSKAFRNAYPNKKSASLIGSPFEEIGPVAVFWRQVGLK